MNSSKYLKEKKTPVFLKFFQKIEEKVIFPNSFSEARITLAPKPKTRKENLRLICFINIDTKTPNKILAKPNSAAYYKDYTP